jgi:hypothetical protein
MRVSLPVIEEVQRASKNEIKIIKICKGKAVPLQAWAGPKDSSSLRLPDFKTIGT